MKTSVAGSHLQGIPQPGIDRGAREDPILQELPGSPREKHQQYQEDGRFEQEDGTDLQAADGSRAVRSRAAEYESP